MPDFHGHRTGVLESSHLRIEYMREAGPRVVRLFTAGSEENLLGEVPDINWDTPGGYFQMFGGHRLWAAPEVPGISYLPDSTGATVEESDGRVTLRWEPPGPGFGKSMELGLPAAGTELRIRHTIVNRFPHPMRAGVWGITVLPFGGEAYLPSPGSDAGLLPDRSMNLWPYSRWDDSRLSLRPAGLVVQGTAGLPPIKIGTFASGGCCAYSRKDVLLVKRFEVASGEYPDRGSNVEVYCSDRFIELETVAPLTELAPGEAAAAEEIWEVHRGDQASQRLAGIFSIGGNP